MVHRLAEKRDPQGPYAGQWNRGSITVGHGDHTSGYTSRNSATDKTFKDVHLYVLPDLMEIWCTTTNFFS